MLFSSLSKYFLYRKAGLLIHEGEKTNRKVETNKCSDSNHDTNSPSNKLISDGSSQSAQRVSEGTITRFMYFRKNFTSLENL